jgi:O-antigen/teichoic acid export membrane protein
MPEIYALLIRNANLAKSCDIASLLCFANVVFSFYAFMSAPAFIEKKTMQLLWLVFVPGIMNFVLCYALIPFFGYRIAIYSTIISYWTQMMIPFFVGYYKKTVSEWLGDRRLIFFVLAIILSDLLLANALMYTAIWMKILLTLLTAATLFLFYRRNRLNELV